VSPQPKVLVWITEPWYRFEGGAVPLQSKSPGMDSVSWYCFESGAVPLQSKTPGMDCGVLTPL